MKYTQELLSSDAFIKNDDLFINSYKECYQKHIECSRYFKFLAKKYNFYPSSIGSLKDLVNAPFVNVDLFKWNDFSDSRYDKTILHLTSSGTNGQKSQNKLDQLSLDNVKLSARNIYQRLGLVSSDKYNYLCFTYDPQIANDLGTAFTDELLTSFTQREEVYYTFQWNEKRSDFVFNKEETYKKLIEFSNSEIPLRILGFPAHLNHLIDEFDIKLCLPENSYLLSGGGWKSSEKEKINKSDFRNKILNHLGIIHKNQRDLFGMVEHGIAYLEDDLGKMRIPNYSRVFVRDPHTLNLKPPGEIGLLQFVCSYNFSYPSFNILSTDWGRVLEDEYGQYLELTGRAGVKKHKGCALSATRLMKGI